MKLLLPIILICSLYVPSVLCNHPLIKSLNDQNFNETILQNQYTFVAFVASWCGHCQKLKPEFELAARILSETHPYINFAQIDAPEYRNLSLDHGVRGYPTLKLYKQSLDGIEFSGARSHQDLILWLKKLTNQLKIHYYITSEEMVERRSKFDAQVIFFGEKGTPEFDVFFETANATQFNYYIEYGHCDNKEIRAKFSNSEKNEIILFNNFDGKPIIFAEELTLKNLKKFIETNSLSPFGEFNDRVAQKVFGEELPFMILFSSNGEYVDILENVAKQINYKIPISYSTGKDGIGNRLAGLLDLNETDYPSIIILETTVGEITQYHFPISRIRADVENLVAFCNDFSNGKLYGFVKTEREVVDNEDEVVKVRIYFGFL